MTRALVVSPTAVAGGSEKAMLDLVVRLPLYGVEPTVALLADGPLREWLSDHECDVVQLSAGRVRQMRNTSSVVRQLAEMAKLRDLVISNQSKGHVLGGLAGTFAGRPAIWWQQGTPDRNLVERTAARVPARVVVCSSDDARTAQVRLTPRHRVVKIPLGIDVETASRRAGSGHQLLDARGWGSGPVVGIVGRLQPWKGQKVFLEAAARICKVRSDVTFAVVGGAILGWEGEYPEELRVLAAELGIADRVHFAGHQDDVYPWFDAMDVVVNASFGEPFGLVLLEALALGRPVVATAAGGPLEIIVHGESGLLVPVGDDAKLADAVLRVLSDDALSEKLSRGARARAWEFDATRMAQEWATLIRQVASAPGA